MKYETKRIWSGSDLVCATCKQKLKPGEVGNVRRCKECRAKAPGRPDPQTAPAKTSLSWWETCKTGAELNQEAVRRHPSGEKSVWV